MTKYNFSAGPAILPREVIEKSAEAVLNYNNSGLSLLEVSHRGSDFIETMDRAVALVKELFHLNDNYEVLFLGGGASSQFFMAPMNLLDQTETAGYVNTGTWASNAIKEAKNFGNIKVLASSEQDNFNHIPKGYEIPEGLKYLHITSNNTIFGTQYHEFPDTDTRLVCDMSSDIFSRPIDVNKFDLIYAGAQKNMGPAGVTLVIVHKEALGKVSRTIPTMLNYQSHINAGSMYNTPPVFPIYVSMLTLEWIKQYGGLEAMASRNDFKANLLYREIDRNSLLYGHSVPEDRSLMNVTFRFNDEDLEKEFLKVCDERGLDGLKGHRSVGGLRASIYNAMEAEGVQELVNALQDFEQERG